jgi:hypothetical protein
MTVKRLQALANDSLMQQFPAYAADSFLKRNLANSGWEFTTLSNVAINQAQVVVTSNGQTSFTLPSTPASNISVQMFLNGQKMSYGSEYTVSGTTVTYSGISLITTDYVEFYYLTGGVNYLISSGAPAVIISPTSLSSNQNDYAPTGFDTSTIVRLTSSTGVIITGFTSTASVLEKKLINVGSNSITLSHQDAGSSTTNRIIVPGGSNITMLSNDSIDIFYDSITARWRVV